MMRATVAAACVLLMVGSAMGDVISQSDSVSFSSDLEADKTITLDSFDTTADYGLPLGQWADLILVTVTVTHEGSATMGADNDDPFNTTNVNARVVRTWALTGPGVTSSASKTVQSQPVFLDVDDTDGGDPDLFDPTPDDGHDFGALGYPSEAAAVLPNGTPAPALYETVGPGTVDFIVDVVAMVNDLQFDVAPDAWQMEVENPILTVTVDLDYEWIAVPEPATASLIAVVGAAVLLRRRRRRIR